MGAKVALVPHPEVQLIVDLEPVFSPESAPVVLRYRADDASEIANFGLASQRHVSNFIPGVDDVASVA